ncbi:DNA mismatch repair protein [Capsulimonas corticalis]|uniref:DNA mismatch repair protein n=1 Tax=Capsulimonas corticalis TaxID=2219043 RepID=A0A402CYE3_9BACT|nr:DNA mismatch repair protein MutS [Capsulimonas corticalis]BDI31369.1 DNA mismatch repair protein [Capsulimonas corticalis]
MITESRPTVHSPQSEYQSRFDRFQAQAQQLSRQDNRLALWRFLSFAAGLAACWPALFTHSAPAWLPAPFAAVFVALWIVHERVGRNLERANRAVSHYQKALDRLQGRWAGKGNDGARFLDPRHPYAIDLDVYGRNSLFERICAVRTKMGEETLARWLSASAAPEAIRMRQEAVRELTANADLREELALLAETDLKAPLDQLAAWATSAPLPNLTRLRAIAAALTLAAIVTGIYFLAGGSLVPLLIVVGVEIAFSMPTLSSVRAVIKAVDRPARNLKTLSAVLSYVDRQSFQSPMLQSMQARVRTSGRGPAAQVDHLHDLMSYLSVTSNPFFALIAAVLMWTHHFGLAIEAWRQANGENLIAWLQIVGEFEALLSLSGYAYENPDDIYPEIETAQTAYRATGLSHPLLLAGVAVRNDLSLSDETQRLLILSGSNMSGKSTLMRAVGANAVLALCGAPVRATSLRISPMQIGASIRTQDSLEDGVSRFYAEIQRLQEIVTLSKDNKHPLLYLLDEIMHGTNSHDRLIGAEAVLRALSARGSLGMATTHDLALARIAADSALAAANVHLEDQIIDGKMSFDYQLRPGVVEKSNALELMRAVGLEV